MIFSEEQINNLRNDVSSKMSEKRLKHTLMVEKMVAKLADIYAPEKKDVLRVAGLLHDVTKEFSIEKQLQICKEFGIITTKQDILTPKTLHAKTAALLIPVMYPEFAAEEVISAVRWHTTGRVNMTIGEKLVYLADYIDESRTFDDCVKLRQMFFDPNPEKMGDGEKLLHLTKVLVASFDMTVCGLIKDNALISEDTVSARNSLIMEACGEV